MVKFGAKGVVADSLIKATAVIGMRGRTQEKYVWTATVGMEACHCSKPLYWSSGGKDWERRDIICDT